jgi:uncharacterized SAM-binding protein YcdF (DUF218 family)
MAFPRLFRSLRRALTTLGALTALWIALAGTRLPMRAYRWLSCDPASPGQRAPGVIVVLGGGGIPSESGLIRCYQAASTALAHPAAEVIVSLPADGDPETASVGRMRDELVLRGVPAGRIRLEHRARSTHEQAEAVARMLQGRPAERVLLVTSEYHLRRSLLAFRKAGLEVAGEPAGAVAAEADMGGFTGLRYRFWHNLANSITLARELTALLAYRLRGWV